MSASAHGEESHEPADTLGFQDRTGSYIPLDVTLRNAEGDERTFAELADRPVILAFLYYRCVDVCEQIGIDLASALNRASAVSGKDYRVAVVSIDPTEGPADARTLRDRIVPMLAEKRSAAAWEFLTGTDADIDRITDVAGFHYRKVGDAYEHPIGLIFVSPEGKITRYVHGLAYLPAELDLSIMEASTGTVGPAVAKVLRMCFSYDPRANRLVFNATRVTGGLTLTVALGFSAFLFVRSRKRRRTQAAAGPKDGYAGGEERNG
jgi:protein SCO1/2